MLSSLDGASILIRADADPVTGGGHVYRCATLGQRLALAGASVILAATDETFTHMPGICEFGFRTLRLPCLPDEEAAFLKASLGKVSICLVDHYRRGYDFERELRLFCEVVAVLDDLPNRQHDCDLLVDQTLGRQPEQYTSLVPTGCQVLLGPEFALLRPQFVDARHQMRCREPGRLQRLLVMVGAADPNGVGPWIHEALGDIDLEVDIVTGPMVRANLASGRRTTIHQNVTDMASLMARADLAIGAAGSASWERCCLGLPALLFVLADNQRDVCQALANAGAAINLGDFESSSRDSLLQAIDSLRREPAKLAQMSSLAKSVCDGQGCDRVTASLTRIWNARRTTS